MHILKSSTGSVAISIISAAQMHKVAMVITPAIKFFLLISLILGWSLCLPFGSCIQQHRDYVVIVTDCHLKIKSSFYDITRIVLGCV